jgi:hypothetical protein
LVSCSRTTSYASRLNSNRIAYFSPGYENGLGADDRRRSFGKIVAEYAVRIATRKHDLPVVLGVVSALALTSASSAHATHTGSTLTPCRRVRGRTTVTTSAGFPRHPSAGRLALTKFTSRTTTSCTTTTSGGTSRATATKSAPSAPTSAGTAA